MVNPERPRGGSRIGDPGSTSYARRALGAESEVFGIPQATFERAERFRRLPRDAAGFVSEMTSSFLERDQALGYLQDRSQRLQTAAILQAEGVRGKELGQIMRDLYTLAESSVKSRRLFFVMREIPHSPSGELLHSNLEIANRNECQMLVRRWVESDPKYTPSSLVIRSLHSQLLEGVESYQRKGLIPLPPGTYRRTDIKTTGSPENFYVRGLDVTPTMQKYAEDLDSVLLAMPELPQHRLRDAIHDASWAYYTFIRIHPFFDGNGRTGRMIAKAVLKRKGEYRDINFDQVDSVQSFIDTHLDTLEAVDHSGDLAPLEIFLAKQLWLSYKDDPEMQRQLEALIIEKSDKRKPKQDVTAIWEGFSGLDLHGVNLPLEPEEPRGGEIVDFQG